MTCIYLLKSNTQNYQPTLLRQGMGEEEVGRVVQQLYLSYHKIG